MALYVAIINTPGYLPEVDPYYADSIGEAWGYLADEYEQGDEISRETWEAIRQLAANEIEPANGTPYDYHILVTSDDRVLAYHVMAVACAWFARCDKPATHLRQHPALTVPGGDGVPCCDRCAGVGARN